MAQVSSLQTSIKFKDTPIGKLPVDWEVAHIGDVCKIVGGSTPSTGKKSYWNGDIPWATPTDITGLKGRTIKDSAQHISQEGLASCAATLLPAGSILMTSRATIGACAVNIVPMATNQGFASLTCSDKVHNWYVYYLLLSYRQELERLASGSTFKEISKRSLKRVNLPVPPATEQRKIAEILTTVDEAIEETALIIEKTRELKKGLMQRLLTRGIGRTETQEERRGITPKGWNIIRLGEICQVVGGSTPSTSERIYWNGDIPWATPTDITGLKGRLITDTGQHISAEGLSSCAATLLPKGSILMTSRATIGACAINTRPMATNQGFSSLVCGRKVYNWFMYYQMLFLRGELERLAGGSTFKEIPKRSIRSISILLPPLSEQRRIADLLNSTDDEIESRETTKKQLHTVKKSLMQVLLTGRVRVKVA